MTLAPDQGASAQWRTMQEMFAVLARSTSSGVDVSGEFRVRVGTSSGSPVEHEPERAEAAELGVTRADLVKALHLWRLERTAAGRIRGEAQHLILELPMVELAGDPAAEVFAQTRASGELLLIPRAGGSAYDRPAFQFDDDGQLLPVVAEVNRALGAADDPWGVASWWISAHPRLLGASPLSLLGGPEEHDLLVLAGVRPITEASDAPAAEDPEVP